MTEKEVLVIKNTQAEGPGLISKVLAENGLHYRLFPWHENQGRRVNPREYKAVFVLGGPQSANDKRMEPVVDFVQDTIESKIPYFGICLGHQLLAKAVGAKVHAAPYKEIGFAKLVDQDGTEYHVLKMTPEGEKDQLFQGFLPPYFLTFQLHAETITLTDRMKLLATDTDLIIPNQVIKVGDTAYGIQSHPEILEGMLKKLHSADPDLRKQSCGDLIHQYRETRNSLNDNGTMMFNNFLQIAGLRGK